MGQVSLESVYTSESLEGSEKLATGVVKTLPTAKKRRESKTITTNNVKGNRPKRNNKSRNRKNNSGQAKNVYENNSSTKVRRRSRKLDSNSVRPGQNSSGIRKK